MAHTRVSYEVAEQIVADYQARHEGASERLVNAYEGYLVNFLNMINRGQVDLRHQPLREFIGLFLRGPERQKLYKSQLDRSELVRVKQMVQQQFAGYSREELWAELVIVLLEMANRYQQRGANAGFHNYVFRAFHFALYRNLMHLISDPLVRSQRGGTGPRPAVAYRGGELPFTGGEQVWSPGVEDFLDEVYDSWVQGLTCSEPFAALSTLDRNVLKLYYLDGLEDREVALVLGCSRATVNRRRLKAKQQIAVALAPMQTGGG